MKFGEALTFVIDDPRWVNKFVYGMLFALLTIVLVGYPFLIGYTLEIMRNVRRGDPFPLPEWTNLGALFGDGLKMMVVFLVWSLPAFVVICLIVGAQVGTVFTFDRGGNPTAFTGLLFLVTLALYALILVVGLAVAVLSPALFVRYAQTSSIAACFRISEVLAIARRNLSAYVLVLLVAFGVNVALSYLGSFALCVGAFAAMAYGTMVSGHLYGQLWRAAEDSVGDVVPA